MVVDRDVVELRGRLVEDGGPVAPAVEGDAGAAVVALDHPVGVLGVDPEGVVVAVRRRDGREGLAAVGRLPAGQVEDPDGVGVARVGDDVHVVPGAAAQLVVVGEALPALAEVVRAEERAVLRLDQRPDAAGARGGGGDAELAEPARRQPLDPRDLGPAVAAVSRLPEAGALAAALEAVGRALRLPEGGVEDVRVVGVDRQVVAARAVTPMEHPLPGPTAVAGAEDAALRVASPGVAERRDVDDVGVAGVDDDVGDVAGVGEADVGPGAAAVGRLVDAVAVRDVRADRRLAGAGVDHVRGGLGDGERADRGGAEEAVRDVLPESAAAGRLPDAAGAGAEVEGAALGRVAGDGDDAPAAVRPDAAPLE